ncbi:MAG: PAC2 family protein, partial [Chloroflexota bacterium]
MSLYHVLDHADLDRPLMVIAFDAWVDAGSAATSAAALLAEGGDAVAVIDGDALYDYRARRPTLRIHDGKLIELEWPELEVVQRRLGQRDVLVLTGPEPDYRWRELASEMVEMAHDLGVVEWMTLGA